MAKETPVGIMMPYVKGDNGYFQQTYSDITRVYTNLKMLLMTSKGERPMMPTYGSDLKSLLFNPNVEDYIDEIFLDSVVDATEKWMPEVIIYEVNVERNDQDYPNQAKLRIIFGMVDIPDTNEELLLEIQA